MIPSRGGTPWATEETSTSYVDRNVKAATLRFDVKLDRIDLVSITDYQKANKFYTRRRRCLAGSRRGVLSGQRHRSSIPRKCGPSATMGANQLVGGLFGMKVQGTYHRPIR